MRLVELEPRWITDTRFAFKCPHCREIWVTCQTQPTPMSQQCDENEAALGEDAPYIPCAPASSWSVTGKDFETMSVTPSLNAEQAGHWHGHIMSGAIV